MVILWSQFYIQGSWGFFQWLVYGHTTGQKHSCDQKPRDTLYKTMVTKGKLSLNLPHGFVYLFADHLSYQCKNGTLQVVGGVWDSCTATKYTHDEKEEIINGKNYLPGLGLYTHSCYDRQIWGSYLDMKNACTHNDFRTHSQPQSALQKIRDHLNHETKVLGTHHPGPASSTH